MENGNARDKTLSTQLKFLKLSLEKVFCVQSLSQSICSKSNLFSGASSIYGAELTENKFKQRNLGGIPGGEIFKRESNQFQKNIFSGPASETLGFLCVLWPDRTATNYICSAESTDGYPDREKPSHLWEQSLELAERRLRRARPRPQPSLCLPWCWRAARPQLT